MATHSRSFPGGEEEARYRLILDLIGEALEKAYAKHGTDQWGRHEFYAILQEEVDETWDEIKADSPLTKVAHEAIQVAAVVIRYLETGDRYRGAIDLGRCWCRPDQPHQGEAPLGLHYATGGKRG